MAHRNPFSRFLALGVFAGIVVVFVIGRALLEWRGEDGGRVAQAGYDESREVERSDDPPTTHRILGQLLLPSGTPPDPTLEVIAWNAEREPEDGTLRAAVGGEQRFELDVPASWSWCAIAVSGRHLYLDVPELARSETADGLVLRPHLGGWVRGAVVAPGPLEDGHVLAAPLPTRAPTDAVDPAAAASPRLVALSADGSFELRGLPPGLAFAVNARASEYPRSTLHEVELGPGETRDLVIELSSDGSLSGIVYDMEGEPADDALVYLDDEEETRRVRTDSAGRFRIDALPPGEWRAWSLPVGSEPSAETAPQTPLEDVRAASVVVEPGIESHVVLGPEPSEPVHVQGTVASAGAPISGNGSRGQRA